MRIGTWNVDCRRMTPSHRSVLLDARCDVWLLTELNPNWVCGDGRVEEFHCHLSTGFMTRKQHWAAVLCTRPFVPLPDPHPASAMAIVDDILFCASILPWRGSGGEAPWVGATHSQRTEATIASLLPQLNSSNLIWGGDWNHSLIGTEVAGSNGGRKALLEAIETLKLQVPTKALMHRKNICNAIDHIAIPISWCVHNAERVPTEGLSDHDAYVVEVSANSTAELECLIV